MKETPPDPPLILGTANRAKAAELIELLAPVRLQLLTLADLAEVPPAPESGKTLAENARLKASVHANELGRWVLADDTGLEVDALAGAPGLRSARFAGPHADGPANRRRLLRELAHVPEPERTARFVCHLALADPSGTIRAESEGTCPGTIRLEPAGQSDFGYDSLFEIVEYHRTLAELGHVAKARLTHRARAVEALLPAICEFLRIPLPDH